MNNRPTLSDVARHRISRWRTSKPEVAVSMERREIGTKFKMLRMFSRSTNLINIRPTLPDVDRHRISRSTPDFEIVLPVWTPTILRSSVGQRRTMWIRCLSILSTSKTYTYHLEFRSYLSVFRIYSYFRFGSPPS